MRQASWRSMLVNLRISASEAGASARERRASTDEM